MPVTVTLSPRCSEVSEVLNKPIPPVPSCMYRMVPNSVPEVTVPFTVTMLPTGKARAAEILITWASTTDGLCIVMIRQNINLASEILIIAVA